MKKGYPLQINQDVGSKKTFRAIGVFDSVVNLQLLIVISSHFFDKILPKKNLQNGVTLKRHCKPAFTKQVFPRFSSPQTPATGSRNSAT